MKCPACSSLNIVKNGSIHNGKQKHSCKSCGRQFVENPENKRIAPETWDLVKKLLLEKISIAGIARVVGISGHGYKNTLILYMCSIEST